MLVLPVSVMEPIWAQFAALLPDRPVVDPTHPLGCHRPRIPDRIVIEQVVAALVHGSGYERIAPSGGDCTTGPTWVWRRRCTSWSWMNGYGKLRRCTEKRATVVRFYLALAAALVVTRCLIREARTRFRWPGRPTTRRLT